MPVCGYSFWGSCCVPKFPKWNGHIFLQSYFIFKASGTEAAKSSSPGPCYVKTNRSPKVFFFYPFSCLCMYVYTYMSFYIYINIYLFICLFIIPISGKQATCRSVCRYIYIFFFFFGSSALHSFCAVLTPRSNITSKLLQATTAVNTVKTVKNVNFHHLAVETGFGRGNAVWPWKLFFVDESGLYTFFVYEWFPRSSC